MALYREPVPGFIDQELVSCAGEVLHVSSGFAVDAIPRRLAHGQEVWPQAANGVLGDVGQGLAGASTEHVAPHRFVDTRHILGSQGLVPDAGHVNGEALAADDLQESAIGTWLFTTQWGERTSFQLWTYHNQGEGDYDSAQQLVGDGVLLVWIPDGLIVTEEPPLEGGVLRCEDEKRKPNCSGSKMTDGVLATRETRQ